MVDKTYKVDRANLAYVRDQITRFFGDVNDRLDTIEDYVGTAPPGGIVIDYLYTTSLAGDPTSGYVGADDLDHALVTEIRLSKTTANGNDATPFIQALSPGDIMGMFEQVAPHGTAFFGISATPVDLGAYYTIAVTPGTFAGQAMPASQDNPVDMYFIGNPNRYLPEGGLTHDVLRKASDTDFDTEWHDLSAVDIDNVPLAPLSATNVQAAIDEIVTWIETHTANENAHHNREHLLYGIDQTDVRTVDPLEQRHVLAWGSNALFNPEFRMNWRGNWGQQEYQKHDVVLDSPYTMIANKVTDDRAAPTPVGDPAWEMPEIPAWSTFDNISLIGSGHLYSFTETVYLNSVRVWVPAVGVGIVYRLTMLRDGIYTSKLLLDLVAGEWNVVGVNPILVAPGSDILYYLESQNSGGTTVVTGGWTRGVNSNAEEPADQSWNVNNALTRLRIDFDDLDTFNRQSELEGIITGSEIQLVETAASQNSYTFQVLAAPLTRTTCVEYEVALVSEGAAPPTIGQTTTITADTPVPQSTEFVGIVGGWTGNQPLWGTVQSFLAYDGVDQGAAVDNQYGVDVNVQRLTVSPDWDLVALSGGSGGGGGEGGGAFPEPPDDGVTYGRIFENWEAVYTQLEADLKFLFNPVEYIDFQDGDGTAWAEGRVFWDEVEHSLSYYNDDSDITVNTGQELVAKVRNNTGSTITNGSVVRVTGAIGNRPTVALTLADKPSTASASGVMTHDLANNTDGYMTIIGVVRGFDTSAWAEGTVLYASDTVPGALTEVQTEFAPPVAIVTLQNNVNGWLYVKPIRPDGTEWWNVRNALTNAVWGEKYRMDTPPDTVNLPVPEQNISEKVGNIVIWNNSATMDNYVTVQPSAGTYFIFDGSTSAPDEPILLSPGEILRVSTAIQNTAYAFAIEAASGFDGAGTFGFVRDPITESGRFLSDTGEWLSVVAPPVGGLQLEYRFQTSTANTPPSGYVRMNNIDPLLVTALYINSETLQGNAFTTLFASLQKGDIVWFADQGGGNTYGFKLDGDGVPAGVVPNEVFTYPIIETIADGTIPDEADIKLTLLRNPNERIPPGGLENEVLAKASSVDYDLEWYALDTDLGYIKGDAPADGWLYARYWDGAKMDWSGQGEGFQGKIGIGTQDPLTRVHVKESGAGGITNAGAAVGIFERISNSAVQISTDDGSLSMVLFGDVSDSWAGSIRYSHLADEFTFHTVDTERMVLNSAGYLGIGVNPVLHPLHVERSLTGEFIASIKNINATASHGLYIDTQGAGSGTTGLQITSGGGANQVLFARADGDIGLGTNAPEVQLHLDGGSSAEMLRLETSGNPLLSFYNGATRLSYIQATTTSLTLNNDSIGNLIFRNAGTEVGRFDSDGDFGIGTTTPDWRLDIEVDDVNRDGIKILNADSGVNATIMASGSSYSGVGVWQNSFVLESNTGYDTCMSAYNGGVVKFTTGFRVERMRIDSVGNVGIGTVNPTAKLDVEGAGKTSIFIHNTDLTHDLELTADTDHAEILWGAANNFNIGISNATGNLAFLTANVERMRILSNGKVGIGTTAPSRDLVVSAGGNNAAMKIEAFTSSTYIYSQTTTGNVRVPMNIDCADFRVIANDGSAFKWTDAGIFCLNATASNIALTDQRLHVNGNVNVRAGFNYYIDGVPISTFIDAPADGNLYARKDNAWSSIGAGAGTVSDLSLSRTSTQNTINNTGGDDVTLLGASTTLAGVMTADEHNKLEDIEPNANNYTHPTHPGDDMAADTGPMSGATVISDLDFNMSSDALGHVTDANAVVSTRQLTPADIGAAEAGDVVPITGGVETLSIAGTNASGTIIRTTVGNLVILTGRLSWTTVSSSTSQLLITGLTYQCTYPTGAAVSHDNLRDNNSQRYGASMTIEAGENQIRFWKQRGEEPALIMQYAHMKAPGHIDINLSYYSNEL